MHPQGGRASKFFFLHFFKVGFRFFLLTVLIRACFQAEVSFVGSSPVSVAVASEPVEFPSDDGPSGGAFPRKVRMVSAWACSLPLFFKLGGNRYGKSPSWYSDVGPAWCGEGPPSNSGPCLELKVRMVHLSQVGPLPSLTSFPLQVQLVRTTAEVPYRAADAFVSQPAPLG